MGSTIQTYTHMSFINMMPSDYYQVNIVKEFNKQVNINYSTPFYKRNPEVSGKLSLNHIELIEYYVNLMKPKNFIELGVQFAETTRRIIPYIPETYIGVDMTRTQNIAYIETNYPNFQFNEMSTDDYFANVSKSNINLQLEMGFIDACHSHEASYKDFLNLKEHMVNDGIIFFHDSYPISEKWADQGLCGDAYKTIEKIRLEHNKEFEIFTVSVNPGVSIARKVTKQLGWLA